MKKILVLSIILLLVSSCTGEENTTNKNDSKKEISTIEKAEVKVVEKKEVKEVEVTSNLITHLNSKSMEGGKGSITNDPSAKEKDALKVVKGLDKPGSINKKSEITLDKGNYKVAISLKIENPSSEEEVVSGIYVDSTNKSLVGFGKEIYFKDFKDSKYNLFSMNFSIKEDGTNIIPWVMYNGEATLLLDVLEIERIEGVEEFKTPTDDRLIFEETQLGSQGGKIIDDEDAQNKKALYAEEGKIPASHISFGPYSERELPGNHTAVFRLKISNNKYTDNVAKLEVYNSKGDGINKSIYIKGNDFKDVNKYQDFNINFIRTDKGSMEYRVYYYGLSNITLDNISILGEYKKEETKTETATAEIEKVEEVKVEEAKVEEAKVEEATSEEKTTEVKEEVAEETKIETATGETEKVEEVKAEEAPSEEKTTEVKEEEK